VRICYVGHSINHFVAAYVNYFARRGDEVHLISLSRRDLPGAINHHPLRRDHNPHEDKSAYLWAVGRVRRLIRRIRPDIVHALYAISNGAIAAASGFHPLVVSAFGTDVYGSINHPIKRKVLRWTMKRADLVNPVSADLESRILSLGVPADKILRLTEGIVVERFIVDRSRRRAGPARLICTRKPAKILQCDRIARALALLAARGMAFECTFAAGGFLEPDLRRLVQDLGLTDRVRFLGGYDNDDLPAMLADVDVYVSASLWDGASPALLEAMASGAFPVVSDIPANREWLSGCGDGLLFSPHSDEQLADCLVRAIQDEPLRRQAVERNRRTVMARADRDPNMGVLATHYERLLARRA